MTTQVKAPIAAPYASRAVAPLGVFEYEGWRLKMTGIAYQGPAPRPELVAAARRAAGGVLPVPAVADGRHGVGFLGIHDGREHCAVFVDWWQGESELHHHIFTAPVDAPARLEDVTGSGLTADAWDLSVIGHERLAWVDTMLANSAGASLDSYLARTVSGTI